MNVGRWPLAVAHAATDTCTSRTLETRIICRSDNTEFTLQLLQTEDPRAICALDTPKSLSALHFTAQMTCLDSLMTGFFRRLHIHSVWEERAKITNLPQNGESTTLTAPFSTRLRIQIRAHTRDGDYEMVELGKHNGMIIKTRLFVNKHVNRIDICFDLFLFPTNRHSLRSHPAPSSIRRN